MDATLIKQAADRMCDAVTGLLAEYIGRERTASLRRLEKARDDYQDATDLDELSPSQEARIRGSVPWNVGR
jgi:hypothetical protein